MLDAPERERRLDVLRRTGSGDHSPAPRSYPYHCYCLHCLMPVWATKCPDDIRPGMTRLPGLPGWGPLDGDLVCPHCERVADFANQPPR